MTAVEVSAGPEGLVEETDADAVDQAAPAEEAEADPDGQTVLAEAVGPEIDSAEDLANITDGTYRLTADIALTSAWTPSRPSPAPWTGTGIPSRWTGPRSSTPSPKTAGWST